jgi:hypothetical protein
VAPSIRKKLAITSPTIGGRSVGIVRSQTQTMEFSLVLVLILLVELVTVQFTRELSANRTEGKLGDSVDYIEILLPYDTVSFFSTSTQPGLNR